MMKQLLAALLMLTCFSAYGALHKWVGADGKVHYSDQPPPPSAKSSTLRQASSPDSTPATPVTPAASPEESAASAPAESQTEAEREAEQKKLEAEKRAAAEKAEQEKARADARKMNCEISQRNLRTLQSGVRLSEVNEAGERVYLDEEQIRQRVEKVQQEIANYCD